jgi:hypothetical protein
LPGFAKDFDRLYQKLLAIASPLEDYRTGHKFKFIIDVVPVEILELDFNPHLLKVLDHKGMKIPVNPLEDELGYYQGREEKETVINMIKERLEQLKG